MDQVNLRESVMINQFVLAAGCPREQAAQILAQAGWQFQTALSIYFQEAVIPKNSAGFSLITPANTPATPPNFPDALTMFSNMSTSDKMATSPKGGFSSNNRFYSTSPGWNSGACFSPTANQFLSPNRFQSYGYSPSHHQQQQLQQQAHIRSLKMTPPHDVGPDQIVVGQSADQSALVSTQEQSYQSEGHFMAMEMEGLPQ